MRAIFAKFFAFIWKILTERMFFCWTLSIFYMFSLLVVWFLCLYNKFDEIIKISFNSFNQILGTAFIGYCLIKKNQHAQYDGLPNDVNRKMTTLGGAGRIISIIYYAFNLPFSVCYYINSISLFLFTICQIIYVFQLKIFVPKMAFLSSFGIAQLLFLNSTQFLVDWIWIQNYRAFGAETLTTSNENITMGLIYLSFITASQHTIWSFYALYCVWENLCKRNSKSTTAEKSTMTTELENGISI